MNVSFTPHVTVIPQYNNYNNWCMKWELQLSSLPRRSTSNDAHSTLQSFTCSYNYVYIYTYILTVTTVYMAT